MIRIVVWACVALWGCGPATSEPQRTPTPAPAAPPPTDVVGPEAADPVPAPSPRATPQVVGHAIHPAKAGRWYPADPDACRAQVDALLAAARPTPVPGRPLALVVPHGGWRFAGPIAAAGFAAVRDVQPDTVVLVGLCHRSGAAGFRGATLLPDGAMHSPLGPVAVDPEVAAECAHALGDPSFVAAAFTGEHSLEVLLPFVQRTWPAARIVPVLFNATGYDDYFRFACALEAATTTLDRHVLLVASTDLAHGADAGTTPTIDAGTLAVWSTLDPRVVWWDWFQAPRRGVRGLATSFCGADPLIPTLWAARRLGATHCTVVARGTSADTPHHRPGLKVVGYAAAVFSAHRPDRDLQARLVHHARRAAQAALGFGAAPAPEAVANDRSLAPGGVFVTLRRAGQLHGCVGRFSPDQPLGKLIADCAASAARDERAPAQALTAAEAEMLVVEVTLCGALEPIATPEALVLGAHGIKVVIGTGAAQKTATYLPAVPAEHDWTRAQLFEHLAAKAGVPAIDWAAADTRVFRFRAFGFSG